MNFLILSSSVFLLTIAGACMPYPGYIYEPSEAVIQAEIQTCKVISNSEKIIYKKYKMEPAGVGISMPEGVVHNIGLAFFTKRIHTRNELRKLAIDCAQIMLNEIATNEEIQPFLFKRPATLENVDVIIHNHDKNGDYPADPEIAVIDILNGALNYSTKESAQAIGYKNEYTETYEKALQALQGE